MARSKPHATAKDVLDRIQVIYLELSPENLAADGERSGAVQRRRKALLDELQACFRWLGREVSEAEAFGIEEEAIDVPRLNQIIAGLKNPA